MIKENIFEENKETQSSLFLAQSYQDAWADYSRALKKERFRRVTSTALIITQIFVEGTLGKLQWRRDYEHDITYHGCRNWQPIWNRNKTVGTGR